MFESLGQNHLFHKKRLRSSKLTASQFQGHKMLRRGITPLLFTLYASLSIDPPFGGGAASVTCPKSSNPYEGCRQPSPPAEPRQPCGIADPSCTRWFSIQPRFLGSMPKAESSELMPHMPEGLPRPLSAAVLLWRQQSDARPHYHNSPVPLSRHIARALPWYRFEERPAQMFIALHL